MAADLRGEAHRLGGRGLNERAQAGELRLGARNAPWKRQRLWSSGALRDRGSGALGQAFSLLQPPGRGTGGRKLWLKQGEGVDFR